MSKINAITPITHYELLRTDLTFLATEKFLGENVMTKQFYNADRKEILEGK